MNPIKLITFIAPTVLGLGFAGALMVPQIRDSLFHGANAAAAEEPVPPQDPDEQKSEALTNLLKCTNLVDNGLHTASQRYHSWVKDPKKGPTGRERDIVGMNTWDDSVMKLCNEQFDANEGLEQFGKLGELSKAYKQAIAALIPKVDEAAKYYNKDMYQADKFEKGKLMHPELEKAFQAFSKASDALNPEIEIHVDERARKNLAMIEQQDGQTLEYWHRKSMMAAKGVQRLMNADKVNYDQLEAALKVYEETVKAIDKASKDGKVPFMWDGYKNHPRAYHDAVAFYIKRHKNNIKFTRQEQLRLSHGVGSDVPGSSDNVVKEFNAMVDGSNAVKYNL